ncbi:MAG: ABC transporter substrate-binding protein [Acidobacteriaceae bacterium]
MAEGLRIISLTPQTTEIVCYLGLAENLVGRSADSDHPEAKKVKVIPKRITKNIAKSDIQREVSNLAHQGTSICHFDQRMIAGIRPDIILTQESCQACPFASTENLPSAKILRDKNLTISINPKNLDHVLDAIRIIADAAGISEQSRPLVERLKYRLHNIPPRHRPIRKPTAVVISRLSPVGISGWWVPEMVKIAGGEPLLVKYGQAPKLVDWYDVVTVNPDVIIFSPANMTIEQVKKDLYLFKYRAGWEKLNAVKKSQVYFLNSNNFLARPGPRLVDGVEVMAKIFHPLLFGYPKPQEAQVVV